MSASSSENKSNNKNKDYIDIIKSFFIEHWPKIAIIIGIILLIIILNAILLTLIKRSHQ